MDDNLGCGYLKNLKTDLNLFKTLIKALLEMENEDD